MVSWLSLGSARPVADARGEWLVDWGLTKAETWLRAEPGWLALASHKSVALVYVRVFSGAPVGGRSAGAAWHPEGALRVVSA